MRSHDYVSTACFHGQHSRCRDVCKFCQTPCLCDCHPKPLAVSGVSETDLGRVHLEQTS